jgi:hypothetical protein
MGPASDAVVGINSSLVECDQMNEIDDDLFSSGDESDGPECCSQNSDAESDNSDDLNEEFSRIVSDNERGFEGEKFVSPQELKSVITNGIADLDSSSFGKRYGVGLFAFGEKENVEHRSVPLEEWESEARRYEMAWSAKKWKCGQGGVEQEKNSGGEPIAELESRNGCASGNGGDCAVEEEGGRPYVDGCDVDGVRNMAEKARETHGVHRVMKNQMTDLVGDSAKGGLRGVQKCRVEFASIRKVSKEDAEVFKKDACKEWKAHSSLDFARKNRRSNEVQFTSEQEKKIASLEIHREAFLSNPTFVQYNTRARQRLHDEEWETQLRSVVSNPSGHTPEELQMANRVLKGIKNSREFSPLLCVGVGAQLYTSEKNGETWLVKSTDVAGDTESKIAENCVDVANEELDVCLQAVSNSISVLEENVGASPVSLGGIFLLPLVTAVQSVEWAAERLLVLANVISRYMVAPKSNLSQRRSTHESRFVRAEAQKEADKQHAFDVRWLKGKEDHAFLEFLGGVSGLALVGNIGFARLGPIENSDKCGTNTLLKRKCYLSNIGKIADWNAHILESRCEVAARVAVAIRNKCVSLQAAGVGFRAALAEYAGLESDAPSHCDPLGGRGELLFDALGESERSLQTFGKGIAEKAREVASEACALGKTIMGLVFDPIVPPLSTQQPPPVPARRQRKSRSVVTGREKRIISYPQEFLAWLPSSKSESKSSLPTGFRVEHRLVVAEIERESARAIALQPDTISSESANVVARVKSVSLAHLQNDAPTPGVRAGVGAIASLALEQLCVSRILGGGKTSATSLRITGVAKDALELLGSVTCTESGDDDSAFARLARSWIRLDPQKQSLSEFLIAATKWIAIQAIDYQTMWLEETCQSSLCTFLRSVESKRVYGASETLRNFKSGFAKEPEMFAICSGDDSRARIVRQCRFRSVAHRLAAESSVDLDADELQARAVASYQEILGLVGSEQLHVLRELEGQSGKDGRGKRKRNADRREHFAPLLRMHESLIATMERAASVENDACLREALVRLGLVLMLRCDRAVEESEHPGDQMTYAQRTACAAKALKKSRKRLHAHDVSSGLHSREVAKCDALYAHSLLEAQKCAARFSIRQKDMQRPSACWAETDWVFVPTRDAARGYCTHGSDRCFFDQTANRMLKMQVAQEVRHLCLVVSQHFGTPPRRQASFFELQTALSSDAARKVEESYQRCNQERKTKASLDLAIAEQQRKNCTMLSREPDPDLLSRIATLEEELESIAHEAALRRRSRWDDRQDAMHRSMKSPRSIADFSNLSELSACDLAAPFQRLGTSMAASLAEGMLSMDGESPRLVCRPVVPEPRPVSSTVHTAGMLCPDIDQVKSGQERSRIHAYVEWAAKKGTALLAVSQTASVPTLRFVDFRTMLMVQPTRFAELARQIRSFEREMQDVVELRAALLLALQEVHAHYDAPSPEPKLDHLLRGLDEATLCNALQMSVSQRALFASSGEFSRRNSVEKLRFAIAEVLVVPVVNPVLSAAANTSLERAARNCEVAPPCPPSPALEECDLYMEPNEAHSAWGRVYAPPLNSYTRPSLHFERAAGVAGLHPWGSAW